MLMVAYSNNWLKIVDKLIIILLNIYILAIPYSTGLLRFIPIFTIFLWFFSSFYRSPKKLLDEFPIFKYIGIFILYLTVTLLWSKSLHAGLKELEDYIYWSILIVFATVVNKNNYQYFLYSFVLTSFVSLFIGYGLLFDFIQPINKFSIFWYLDYIDYSIFLSLGSLIVVYMFLYKKNISKVLLSIVLLVLFYMLFNSMGRSGQYSFLIASSFMLFNYFGITFRNKILVISILILSVLTMFYTIPSFNKRVLSSISDIELAAQDNRLNTSLGIRFITAKLALQASIKSPILGYGIGDTYEAYLQEVAESRYKFLYRGGPKTDAYHPHCQYMFVLYRSGFIGLFLFLLMLYKLYTLEIKNNSYIYFHRAMLFVLIFTMLFNNVLKASQTTAMFLTLIAIGIGLSKKSFKQTDIV